MDEARAAILSHPKHGQGSRYRLAIVNVVREVFSGQRLSQVEQTLDRAATAAAIGGSEIDQQRVAFIRAGFEVVRKMLAAATLMDRVRATKGADTEAVASVISLWQDIQTLTERFPHSVNYTRLRTIIEKKVYMGNVQDIFGPPSEAWLAAATNAPAKAATPAVTTPAVAPATKALPKSKAGLQR